LIKKPYILACPRGERGAVFSSHAILVQNTPNYKLAEES